MSRPNPPGREPEHLFAYGTLGPGGGAEGQVDFWEPDAVRGRLYDLGPYPALTDLDAPGAGWVEGHVRPVDASELRARLDPYEGVADGPFRRTATTTRAGRAVWIYVYRPPMPTGARGPLARWRASGRA